MCLSIHMINIGGWGSLSNREIVSFRSCVRASGRGEAKLCALARRCCFRGWVAKLGKVLRLPRLPVPLPMWYVSYLRPCDRKFALVISPGPLDFSSDAECILSCLVAFGDVPNEFPNLFGSGFVALDPRCEWSPLALA